MFPGRPFYRSCFIYFYYFIQNKNNNTILYLNSWLKTVTRYVNKCNLLMNAPDSKRFLHRLCKYNLSIIIGIEPDIKMCVQTYIYGNHVAIILSVYYWANNQIFGFLFWVILN